MAKTRTEKRRAVPHRNQRLPKSPQGGVELLLIQPVEYLGKQGDVVRVRPGYALNYLLPQGLATVATEHHKRMVDKHRSQLEEIERARLSELRAMAEKLSRQSVTIEANANDEGHLYGSVGPAEIVSALKRAHFNLAQEQVRLKGPLKELGLYTIQIHVGHEVEADLKVWVVPAVGEQATAAAAPAAGEKGKV